MEFEKSIFRIHQRILQVSKCKCILVTLMLILPVILVFQCLNFTLMHWYYVNEGSLL